MVVRIDVIEEKEEAIGIFLLLFFNFDAPGKSFWRRQYRACVQLFLPLNFLALPMSKIKSESTPEAAVVAKAKKKKKKEN